jgi:ComF family protein
MLNLLFPKVCNGCSEILAASETVLCASCRHALPLACFHKTGNEHMKHIFYGRIPVQNATALFKFQKKGITQQLLHNLKYRGQQDISYFLGAWMGAELAAHPDYRAVDLVIPVPLHRNKLRERGYNQVAGFGKEIALALNVPYRDDLLLKISKTRSQVFKARFTRFQGEKIFQLHDEIELKDKHILLVDDIVTTGATLENCGQQLLNSANTRLSLATMAVA